MTQAADLAYTTLRSGILAGRYPPGERLGELEVVLGPQAIPVVAEVGDTLRAALAARDRGDPAQCMRTRLDRNLA